MHFICSTCGQSFKGNNPKNGPKPKYCGRRCWPSSALPHTRIVPDKQNCTYCGKTFSRAARGGSRAEFCSDRCKFQNRLLIKRGPAPIFKCVICDCVISNDRWTPKQYCEAHRNVRIIKCKGCTIAFIGQKGTQYCSNACRGWSPKRRSISAGVGSHRRRARHYGVQYEPVDPLTVFERDRWRCGICKRHVDSSLKYPHPKSASLDHIIPMSWRIWEHGHTYVNTRCSHLECNVRRGNRMNSQGEQLALVG